MQKLNKKEICVKCGFIPTYSKDWKLEFKDDCTNFGYNKCDWDTDVAGTKEHLHQECPDCGYIIVVPCQDSEAVKANTWSTTGKITSPPAAVGKNTVKAEMQPLINACNANAGRGVAQPVTTISPLSQRSTVAPVFKSATPAKCSACPVDAE